MRIQLENKKITYYLNVLLIVVVSFVSTISIAETTTQTAADRHYQLLQQAERQRQQALAQAAVNSSRNTNSSPMAAPITSPALQATNQAQRIAAAQREATFNSILQNTLPMTPSQIKRLHRMYDKTQQAAESPANVPPSPTSTTLAVDLSPGAVPPVIRLSQGFVTSMVFVDSTGAPWPIEAYDLGNPKAFNIQWDKKNTLMVQAMNPYMYGNIAIKLRDQPIPVMATLVPGQRIVDYRVDLRVSGYGPNANSQQLQESRLPSSADPTLLSVLDGVPPADSQTVHVDGGDAQAWRVGSKVYLRTHYNVLSPAWLAKMSSADGTNAYLMSMVPIILVERSGKTTQLNLRGLHDDG